MWSLLVLYLLYGKILKNRFLHKKNISVETEGYDTQSKQLDLNSVKGEHLMVGKGIFLFYPMEDFGCEHQNGDN